MTADDIIAAARACLGTPFRHQGRVAGEALDCAGLAVQVARACGCAVVDAEAYGPYPARGQLETALAAQPGLQRLPAGAVPQPGDLLLMRFAREPQHLAILAGETIIHAWTEAGKVCEHDFTAAWQRRVCAVYRFVEVGGE